MASVGSSPGAKKAPRRVVSEAEVEAHLVFQVRKRGGVIDKVVALNRRGFFDRIVVLPGNRVFFVELKRPKGRPTRQQADLHAAYRRVGAQVEILDSVATIDAWLGLVDGGLLDG